jgi:hypothetical protein
MKFMITYTFKAELRDQAIARFKKTGGQPPAGATLVGRWTAVDLSCGFVLLDSSDAKVLTEFGLAWSDLMDLRAVAVVDDGDLVETLQHAGR